MSPRDEDEVMSEREMAYELVTTNDRLVELLDTYAEEPRYAIDTEFDNRRTYYPRLALVQIAWPTFIMLVDPFSVDVTLLATLFASEATAIAHAASNDISVLDRYVNVRPSRLFDTQIAAQLTGMRGASLAYLASELLSLELDKSEQTSDWTVRPISAAAEIYAINDVAHLFDIADELFTDLTRLGRLEAFEEECDAVLQAVAKEINPRQSWWHLSNRETLRPKDEIVAQYLCAVREELAEMLNVPKRFLVPDDVITSLCSSRPTSVQAMAQVLGRRVERDLVPQFVDAMKAALASDGSELERPGDDRSDDQRGLIAMLQALVWQRSSAMEIDPAVLASKNDILARLDGRPSKFDRPWRADIITRDVDAIIAGTASLAWRHRQLEVIAL